MTTQNSREPPLQQQQQQQQHTQLDFKTSHHQHQFINDHLEDEAQNKDQTDVAEGGLEEHHRSSMELDKKIVAASHDHASRSSRSSSSSSNGRERLKRHRLEVAGNVWIPEIWGQEDLLKDWIDCTAFDVPLCNSSNIMSARLALVEEGRRATSSTLQVAENGY